MCGPTNIKPAKQANEPLPSAAVREYTSQKFARGMTAFGWRDPCFGKDVASIPDIVNYQEPRGGARLKIPFPAPVELVDKIKRDNQKAGKEPSHFFISNQLRPGNWSGLVRFVFKRNNARATAFFSFF